MPAAPKKLTERLVAGLVPTLGAREAWLSDTEVPGLRLRATAGVATYFACWTDRATGERRREKLGPRGALTLEQARDAARAVLGGVARGDDPQAKRAARRAEVEREREASRLTLRVLLGEWARLGLKERRETYRAEAVRAVSHAFAEHLDKPAHRLSRDAAVGVLDGLAEAGKAAMAGRTMAYGRACYAWVSIGAQH